MKWGVVGIHRRKLSELAISGEFLRPMNAA